tara:strand:- start:6688 stop:7347 length:660 start_codon:yes stop_codon:yes gene_type:complete
MNIKKYKYKLHGRNKGRKNLDNLSDTILNLYRLNINKDIDKKKYNVLDIGSGSGENAILLSKNNPKAKIITCEVYRDGNINLCQSIEKNRISNISLFQGNVLELFYEIKTFEVFDEIWILFPDPWPKLRHHKRRLINKNFFNKIYSFLKQNGRLFIASDSISYNEQIIKLIYEIQSFFLWKNQKFYQWDYNSLDLPRTKFYKKALKSNRKSMFFELNKI